MLQRPHGKPPYVEQLLTWKGHALTYVQSEASHVQTGTICTFWFDLLCDSAAV